MNANQAWIEILSTIIEHGKVSVVKNTSTKEIVHNHVSFDMNYPICYHQDRRLNYAFSAIEAYEIANGDNRVENLARYNKNIAQFSDDNLIFNGAYGPPFNEQLMYVVNTLKHSINSRQAVCTIWKQNPIISKDIRCTVSLQFLIRDDAINTIVYMRSSDCWLGIPYDFFNFTIMTLRVLTLLNKTVSNISLGNMYWTAGSSHAYGHDISKILKVLSTAPDKETKCVPPQCLHDWNYIVNSLQACYHRDDNTIRNNNLWEIRP